MAVAHAEHFEHAGVGLRRAQQPIVEVGVDALADRAIEFKTRVRHGVKDQARVGIQLFV